MPSLLPTNSEKIIRISASDRLSRNPARILGSAAGTMSLLSRCHADSRNARAVSSCTASTEAAPSIVLSRIGHTVPNTIVATSIGVPILNTVRAQQNDVFVPVTSLNPPLNVP